MATYTNDELKAAVSQAIDSDAFFRDQLSVAIEQRNRGWLADLIIGVAHDFFGFEIGSIVERVVDWFMRR